MSTPIPVIWLSLHGGIDARGPWDTKILERLFDGYEWSHGLEFEHNVGVSTYPTVPEWTKHAPAIVVIPARHHCSPEDIVDINWTLSAFTAVLLILCGDEEGQFPWKDIKHPNIRFWVQMPDPVHYADMAHFGYFFGNGAPHLQPSPDKTVDYAFIGQGTNPRRRSAIAGLKRAAGRLTGMMRVTAGFAQGEPPAIYLDQLGSAWFAPAPSGPCSVDTFRAYEALEQGCIPIVDGQTPAGPTDYWHFVYGDVPFPIIDNWDLVGGLIEYPLQFKERLSAECSAWWQQQKRNMTWRLRHDLGQLGFDIGPKPALTAIVTTSPVKSNPDLSIIQTTIASIRHHFGEQVEIIIACDDVRPEQADMAPAYHKYLFELCRWTEQQRNIVPYLSQKWVHQARLTFDAITRLGANDVLLFAEHDTPFVTDEPIDVEKAIEVVAYGLVDVLRFHHESHILDVHEYLMVDHETVDLAGLPVRRTHQWSQRPHLADSRYYVAILAAHFSDDARTMIEDKMHSVAQRNPRANRLAIYHPDGNIKRTYHLDGRGDAPKFEMRF